MNKLKILIFLRKICPPILLDYLLQKIIKIDFIFFPKKILKRNKILKNSAKGRVGFLLATGPSVNKQDLAKLEKYDCFSLSSFFLHKDLNKINPKYHFFAPYHKPLIIEDWVKWINLADKSLPKNTKIVLSIKDYERVKNLNLLKDREVIYLYFSKFIEVKNLDIAGPLPDMQTHPLMVLPFMIYMGYKEIYLIGCDSNNLKNYGRQVENFYDQNLEIKKGSNLPWSFGITKELENNLSVFNQFKNYKKLADNLNIKIINLSEDSWLDFFDKENYDALLKKIN
tara:strand:- start:1057 stop:1905 length:849 start_codon:yes stop_codon:yes gene_type:complete